MAINFGQNELGYASMGSAALFDDMDQGSLLIICHPAILGSQRCFASKGDNPATVGWVFDTPADTDDFRFQRKRATSDCFARSDANLVTINEWQLFGVSWDLRGVADACALWYGNFSQGITAAEVPAYKTGDPHVGSGAINGTKSDAAKELRFANTDAASTANAFSGKIGLAYLTQTPLDEGDVRRWMWRPHILGDNLRGFWIFGLKGLAAQDVSGYGHDGTVNVAASTRIARHVDVLGFHFGPRRRSLAFNA